jgi:hypothetical protein
MTINAMSARLRSGCYAPLDALKLAGVEDSVTVGTGMTSNGTHEHATDKSETLGYRILACAWTRL